MGIALKTVPEAHSAEAQKYITRSKILYTTVSIRLPLRTLRTSNDQLNSIFSFSSTTNMYFSVFQLLNLLKSLNLENH